MKAKLYLERKLDQLFPNKTWTYKVSLKDQSVVTAGGYVFLVDWNKVDENQLDLIVNKIKQLYPYEIFC